MIYFHLVMIGVYILLAGVLIGIYLNPKTPARRAGEVDYFSYGSTEEIAEDFSLRFLALPVALILFHIFVASFFHWVV